MNCRLVNSHILITSRVLFLLNLAYLLLFYKIYYIWYILKLRNMKQFYKFFSKSGKAKYTLRNAILGFGFLLGNYQSANAQVSSYTFAQSAGTYTPITGTVLGTATGNTTTTNLNSEVYPVTLPFGFIFNGVSYTSLNVSSNGFITFGSTAPTTTNTTPINSTAVYEGAVSAFGRDISSFFDVNSRTGNIAWEVIGAAPNREVVIQWKDFKTNNTAAVTSVYSFSFQIRLQETSNVVKVVYDAGSYLIGSTAVSSTVQVGLRGNSNTDFNNRLNLTTVEYINSAAGTANSSTQNFSTTNAIPGMPTAGLTYSWTPPTCFVPIGVNITGISTTSAVVNWLAPSPAPSSYDVYYSTSNTAPTSATAPTLTGLTGLTTTMSPLQPATNYYVWVRSVCSASGKSVWTAVTGFATQCNALSGAYFEDFESYTGVGNGATGGVLPTCWNNFGTAQGGHVSNSASSVISGTKTLYLWTSGTTYVANVALPPMNTLQSGDYRLKFDGKASVTAGGIIQLGYLDSASAFVQLTSFSVPTTGTVYNFSFDIPALPVGVNQLVLKNPGTPANSLSIDNLSYELKTLGTSEVAEKVNLKVYPNPFSDIINVSDIEKVKSMTVIDFSGRVLKVINTINTSINLSDLKSGIYILNVEYKDGNTSSHKIIKK